MELQTPRLTIRFVRRDDWKEIVALWEDFARSPYARYDAPRDTKPDAVQAMAARWAELAPLGEHMFFAVCLGARMIGMVDFHRMGCSFECGYCFHSAYHGKGYALESIAVLLDALLDDGGRCYAGTAINNLPSVKLLKSLGFRKVEEEEVSFYKDERGEPITFAGGVYMFEKNANPQNKEA